jgi:ABC-type lipoprotein release transport system permease subunit
MIRATTTKQLMDQSKLFRFLFWGSIACICIGTISFIIFPFTDCSYRSCAWSYPSAPYECKAYGSSYCCSSYQYCGDYRYCWPRPIYPCIGWMIAGSTLIALGFLFAIVVFIMFCNFRNRIKNGTAYLNMPSCPVYPSPIIVYSNQNLPQPQYQQYVQNSHEQHNVRHHQVNISENWSYYICCYFLSIFISFKVSDFIRI